MHDDLDAAIDRAVHDMLDVEPSPALRARVMLRIEESERGSGLRGLTVWRWSWLAAPVAAAALVIIAVSLRMHEAPLVSRPVVVSVTVPTPPAQGVARVVPERQPTVAEVREMPRIDRARPRAVQVAAAAPDTPFNSTVTIVPLRDVQPIVVRPIGRERLAAEPTAIAPLAPIEPITIEPLSPPTRRN